MRDHAALQVTNQMMERKLKSSGSGVLLPAAPATILNVTVLRNKVFQMEERIGLFILARQRES